MDQIVAIANSTKYGGAGYASSELATVAGANGSAREIALHELGHSLGNLADEYHYSDGATYAGGEPAAQNLSRLTASEMGTAQTKWFRWLGTSDATYDGNHSTFQGGGYYQFGLYRPSNNSKMRSLGRPFNLVSVEALIVEFYKIVRPIDDSTPTDAALTGSEQVFVEPVQPISHALDIAWALDGLEIGGATGNILDLAALSLTPGAHTLTVQVSDPTPLVRNEALRDQWLRQTLIWSVFVPQCAGAGDLNCDGITSVADISGFVLALTDPNAYAAAYPDCSLAAADVNCDGAASLADIAPFVALLSAP